MPLARRRLLALAAATALAPAIARAAPALSGVPDVTRFGVRPGGADDQSRALQRAIDESARSRSPLAFPPGVYRANNLTLPAGAQLVGVRGASRLVLGEGDALITASGADHVTLSGLSFDGRARPLPQQRALVAFDNCRALKIADCEFSGVGGNGLAMAGCDGEIVANDFADIADVAIHSRDARGLAIARNRIYRAGNNGIQVWRQASGDDGTLVVDNRIEAVANRAGGSGQYGNAVSVFRAGNVVVRGNRIRDCAFSAVRGNAAANLQIEGNSVSDVREVALYAEFGFEGALIANNTVDGAAIGVSVTNFDAGGRLAVVQGNIIRNLLIARPIGTDPNDGAGIGIAVEADTAVTGNVIEDAPFAGIVLGHGRFLRDVAATGNVVRKADIGIAVSVAEGAGTALIANNVIAEVRRGAIVGLDHRRIVTGDLSAAGAGRYAHLTITGNRVR